MKAIIFRCDSSEEIGSGHVMRCLNVAREMKGRDREIIFVSRTEKQDKIARIREDFNVLEITEEQLNAYIEKAGENKGTPNEIYETIDARLTTYVLNQAGIKDYEWIIVDNYRLGEKWEQEVKKHYKKNNHNEVKILAIDDLADRKHDCEIVVDQNYYGKRTQNRYDKLVREGCKKLLGPKYAILGKEYKNHNNNTKAKESVKRIMIYFGSVDKENLTQKTINA